ncbi:hypothetical protein, partial [Klebsiella aerogenes]|uniref:hypothetical protein n=1 Tax=Klebsiella aerogenes TaxID=548 RepID=UPI00195331CE
CAMPPDDRFSAARPATAKALAALVDTEDMIVGDETSFFAAPASLDSLCRLMTAHPDAVLVGGATDVG